MEVNEGNSPNCRALITSSNRSSNINHRTTQKSNQGISANGGRAKINQKGTNPQK
jgi:hypothetical protein